jgi:hypothetical protein
MPLKSTKHHNAVIEPEEVEEEPMTTAGAQGQQWWVTVRA